MLVRDASVLSPPHDFRAVARHHRAFVRLTLTAHGGLPRVLGLAEKVRRNLAAAAASAALVRALACDGYQRAVGYALVIHAISFPSAVLPIAPAMRVDAIMRARRHAICDVMARRAK